jgi:phosphotransferase system enzyme I (PtsI)
MRIKRGIPVSPGVAISQAVVLDAEDVPVPRRHVHRTQIAQEQQRVAEALTKSCDDLQQLRAQAAASIGEEPARIFDFHIGMLRDPALARQFDQRIEHEAVKGEYAVYIEMRQLANMYQQQDSRYFRDRVGDIWDLERRVLGHLIGTQREQISQLSHEAVLISHDLTPSQTAALDKSRIKGIATDAGGRTSHTAILAHALGIPAIVGLEDITAEVNSGETVIIDGNRGQVIIDPDAAQLLEYRQHIKRISEFESSLVELVDLPAETTDGETVALQANIEFPEEIAAALDKGAQGIGLYRTEFLFLASESEPTEDEQVESYTQAINALGGRPMTIRTLDLGADKMWNGSRAEHTERNPFLGLRSIRFCLQHLPLFNCGRFFAPAWPGRSRSCSR